jgi:tRNA-dihydrouridine synthase
MLEETGCDAVMIGRGVLGNPWLIKECVNYLASDKLPEPVSNKEKISMMKEHYNLLKNDKNEKVATMEMRTHILYYLKGMPNSKEMKNKVCMTKNSEELIKVLDEYEKGID